MAAIAQPLEISFALPKAPHAILHGHLTFLEACAIIHLTTSEMGESGSSTAPLGSFVYAMPDRSNEKNVISTALSSTGSSIDYATRLSKILARKMKLPVYVGCSMSFAGITPEEEIEGLTRIVEEVMAQFNNGRRPIH
ncbi:hypothetical protein H2198_005999 [Neophaeococcomyces mojaviensis]|uniref:Uncharacterized protein n=1 Tax=Neophaeococcomyces mojaviensis TaxID=3383035 RepID=A0ACC3A4M5_9EURO|nr:hypothetical protein H2198_005999 [Knufia sp. JES_112]